MNKPGGLEEVTREIEEAKKELSEELKIEERVNKFYDWIVDNKWKVFMSVVLLAIMMAIDRGGVI